MAVDSPVVAQKLPATQLVQLVDPVFDWNVPGPQLEQLDVVVKYVPAEHMVRALGVWVVSNVG